MDTESIDGLSVRDLAAIWRRQRRVIYGTLLTCMVLAFLYCLVATRRYEAIGTLQVQKESSDTMGLQSLIGAENGATDALEANIDLQTQANILQSDTLALSTIKALHLEGTKDFQPRWSPVGWLLGVFSPGAPKDPPGASLEQSPQRQRRLLQVFRTNLKVSPVGGTRIIQIQYLDSDPKLAADVVNFLMSGLVDYTFQTRFAAMTQTSQWLTGQLGGLRKQSEELQSRVVNLQRQSGVYSIGTMDAQGHEQAYSSSLDQLQQATVALTQAEQNRILKGAIAQAAENGNAELLSGLAGNANSQSMNNSMGVIEHLREQEASQQVALQEAEAKYGSAYPTLVELRANIAALERALSQEFERIRNRAKSDYTVAEQSEANTRRAYEEAKQTAAKLNDKATEFAIANQEADQSRQLYEDLLKRLKEAGVLEGVRSSNITVVDPGRVPAKPKTPNVPLFMIIGLGAGLFLGGVGSFLIDVLDDKIKTVEEAERAIGQSLMSATPLLDVVDPPLAQAGQDSPLSLNTSNSAYVETVRGIRTALILPSGQNRSRVILVTSSIAREGKTLLSTNLAGVLAQSERRVLLVDTDMRRGELGQRLNLPIRPGLSELLAGERKTPDIYPVEGQPFLEVLQAGRKPQNPSELLDRRALEWWISEWRKKYDFIVLDGTPLLMVTDALLVNRLADVTLLLARVGFTERAQLRRAFGILNKEGRRHRVEVVLNGMCPRDQDYSEYFGD